MKKILFFCCCFILLTQVLLAQKNVLSGKIQDTLNLKGISYATVSLVRKSDSVLVKHIRTSQTGNFTLTNIPANKYQLIITHPVYIDFVDEIEFTSLEETKNLGTINLYQRGQLLKEFVVKNSAAIRIKGDTLEYLADSFKVKQGAVVEDLLKVLPGIQVNKNGEITAQGEKVEKVLVDGEEFFGDDPTVATQNIQSKTVEKVQVFDKKSDQAAFTGFDDGQTEKTINLKLKDNMNKGAFGKVELGGGWEDRWNNKVLLSKFKNKEQMSIYGIMSSTGNTGLGWEDNEKYTGGNDNMTVTDDGGRMFSYNSDNDEGNYNFGSGNGITKAWTGGARYANKWDDNKQHVNINYSSGKRNNYQTERNYTETLLPNAPSLFKDDTTENLSSKTTHRLTIRYDWTIDTTLNLIYNLNARLTDEEIKNNSTTINKTATETPLNRSQRNNNNNTNAIRINNTLTINKKLKKVGRTISSTTNFNNKESNTKGTLTGLNNFYISGSSISQILDQQKANKTNNQYFSTTLTYTEPITKKILLKTYYTYTLDNTQLYKNTFEDTLGTGTIYTYRIDSLSNNFVYNTQKHLAGIELKYTEKKYNITAGVGASNTQFIQDDLIRNQDFNYSRINLYPTLRFNYKFNQFRRFSFTYSGSTKQPSITQIAPLQDNSNPLEISIGNPNLKLGYNQNFNLNYFNYQAMSGKSLWSGLWASNNFNAIALNRTYDNLGRTINQYVNLKGGYNLNLYAGYNSRIKSSLWDASINTNFSLANSPSILNNVTSKTINTNISLTPRISYNKEDKMNFSLDLSTNYNQSSNSVQTNRKVTYISFTPSTNFTYYLPKDFEAGTDMELNYQPKTPPYQTSFSRFIWNAYVSKKILPKRNLAVSFTVNDILNQNNGYSRASTNNYNTESFFNTLSRYWMLSAIWNFNTSPMTDASNDGRGKRMGGMRPPSPHRKGASGIRIR